MKKISLVLASVLLFVSVFSMGAYASSEVTKTEAFFSKLAETQSLKLVNPKDEEITGVDFIDFTEMSVRMFTDEAGNKKSEMIGSFKIGFMEVDMFALQSGLYIYFPQYDRHMDYSFIYKDKIDEVIEETSSMTVDLLLPVAYSDLMTLKSAGEQELEGYGKAYVETFSYDLKSIVKDLEMRGLVPNPNPYGVNFNDNEEVGDFILHSGADNASWYSDLAYQNEAFFAYDENGNLIACDYFAVKGERITEVEYEVGFVECIEPVVNANDFILPESSMNLEVFMMFVRLIFSFVNN